MDKTEYLSRFSNEKLVELYSDLERATVYSLSQGVVNISSNNPEIVAIIDALADSPKPGAPGQREQEAKRAVWDDLQRRRAVEIGDTQSGEKAEKLEQELLEEEAEESDPESIRFRKTSPDTWRGFHERFRALAEEELKFVPHDEGHRGLDAYGDYTATHAESGSWKLSDGLNEFLQARFEVEATRAGVALGPRRGVNPQDFWLHQLFSHLSKRKSKLLFAPSKRGGIIRRVCEASAVYCSRLEKRALEAAQEQRQAFGTNNEGSLRRAARRASLSAIRPAVSPPPLLALPSPNFRQRAAEKRPGPKPKFSRDFVEFAGRIWAEEIRKSPRARVSEGQLAQIAAELDARQHIPPADFLEKQAADELKAFNSRNSNSKTGSIKTWTKLVEIGDKDQLRAMRKLLSRCVGRRKTSPFAMSGN